MRFLSARPGEIVKLVMTDLYAGQHERTEFTVVSGSTGQPLRHQPAVDGLSVFRNPAGGWYARLPPFGAEVAVHTLAGEKSETARTPCRKAGHPRRKCPLCDDPTGGTTT